MIGNRSQLIEATKRKTLLSSGKEVDSIRAFLDYSMSLQAFVSLLHEGKVERINEMIQYIPRESEAQMKRKATQPSQKKKRKC